MSLFSRFFRKAPPPAAAPQKLPATLQAVDPVSSVPDTLLAAREEAALQAAIAAHDTATIARLVVEGTSTKVRQLAAQAVDDPVKLRELIRDVRGGNDKRVYKILTSKRDALLVQARKLEQLQAEVSAVAAAIERHCHRPYDSLFGPSLEQLETRWQAVAPDADPETLRKVQQAIDRSREVIAQHLRQIALEASRELAATNAVATAQRLRESEEKAAALAAAERANIVTAESQAQAEARDAERKAESEKREAHALALRQVGGLARRAQAALDDGSTGQAAGLRRLLEEKLPAAAPLPAYLASQLQQLDVKLNELKDWKSFSVAPKRVELLEEMESLIGSTQDPATLAVQIKSLQSEWRTLGKGAGENLDADWQRFQDASRQAYQPCHEYFAAQALVRQENLQQRTALLARLVAFEAGHNWEQPDWRLVLTALRESKQEWRRYSVVDRAAGKASQERFAALTSNLQHRLDAEYARNVEQKTLLIERAQQLLAGEDSRRAGDAVKDLQQKWQAVGPVPRDEDHRLWERFRQHCDAVFARRSQEFTAYAAVLEANKAKAITLCAELERVATLSGPEFLAGAASVAELSSAFAAIDEFPKEGARELRRRFERALERFERAVAQQQALAVQAGWTDLFDAANRVRAYRLALARNADETERDRLRQAAQDSLTAVDHWPKGGLAAIKYELAKTDSSDIAANEVALRMLCVRAEILTDTPTPAEDQPLRREYQVKRLMESMGQGSAAAVPQLDTLALEWLAVGPTEDATYTALLHRFQQCRQR